MMVPEDYRSKRPHKPEEPTEEEQAAEADRIAEGKAKAEALKATIGKCVVCLLDLAYVDNYTDDAKYNPVIKPLATHQCCTPIREAQKRIEALSDRLRGAEQRINELQRIAMDRAMPRSERVRRAVEELRVRAARALHRFADRAERRGDDA